MVLHRLFLAVLIALGLTLAPVAGALASSHAMAQAAMADCHGTSGKDCPCADKANCSVQLCAFKCTKLIATFSAPPTLVAVPAPTHELAYPRKPPHRLQRPPAPPPRS